MAGPEETKPDCNLTAPRRSYLRRPTQHSIEIEHQVKNEFLYYNLGYAFRPLTLLQSIFGVRRSLGSETLFRKICCVSALIVIPIAAAAILHERRICVYAFKEKEIIATDILSLLALSLSNLYNVFVSAFHTKLNYLTYFKNNEKLLKLLKFSPERYKNGRQIVLTLLGIVFLPFFLVCCFDFYARVTYHDTYYASLYLINYLFITMNTLVTLHFVCSLILHRNAFLMINVKTQVYYDINYAKIDNKVVAEYYERSPVETLLLHLKEFAEDAFDSVKNRSCNVDELMQAYVINCHQSRLLNKFFTEQNFLMFFNSLILLVRCLYYVTSTSRVGDKLHMSRVVATCLVAAFETMKLFGITASCEAVHAEARKTSVILDKILSKRPTGDIEEFKLWATLTSRGCPTFTACNCLRINFGLMYQLAKAVTTYLIVLTQLSLERSKRIS